MGIANNDVIKTAVDLITGLITGVNKLTEVLPGPASGLAKIAVGLAGIKGGGKIFDALFRSFEQYKNAVQNGESFDLGKNFFGNLNNNKNNLFSNLNIRGLKEQEKNAHQQLADVMFGKDSSMSLEAAKER